VATQLFDIIEKTAPFRIFFSRQKVVHVNLPFLSQLVLVGIDYIPPMNFRKYEDWNRQNFQQLIKNKFVFRSKEFRF
jgi:hypothetical protein